MEPNDRLVIQLSDETKIKIDNFHEAKFWFENDEYHCGEKEIVMTNPYIFKEIEEEVMKTNELQNKYNAAKHGLRSQIHADYREELVRLEELCRTQKRELVALKKTIKLVK